MIQKIKSYLLPVVMLGSLLAPIAVPVAASAAVTTGACGNDIANNVSTGAADAGGSNSGSDGDYSCNDTNSNASDTIKNIASSVVTIFSIVVGAISVIMIIYGGFRYITSGGSSDKVGNAKNTLLYAIIGLIIVALAQLIVHFVLSESNNVSTGSGVQTMVAPRIVL